MTGCMRSGVVTLQRHARGQRIKMFSWNCWFKRIPTDIIVAITVHTYTVMGYFILRTVQNFPGVFFLIFPSVSKLLVFRILPRSMHSATEIFYNVTRSESNISRFGRMLCDKNWNCQSLLFTN